MQLQFSPDFSKGQGLISAVAVDEGTGEVLMLAWMNEEAFRLTLDTGRVHYFSRSRNKLWKKGEESGHVLDVTELRVDCDQDAVQIKVRQSGPGVCHTGRHSCFYRAVPLGGDKGKGVTLEFVDAERVFDPAKVYEKK